MANQIWSGVAVDVESAIATAIAITGITKADPAVVSHAGTDPTDGDLVLVLAKGMNRVNARVFRVDNAAAGTFELEGEDSTDFDTFTSGTFQVLTMGTSLSTITQVSPSGGEPEYADTTTIHDLQRTQIPTVTSPIEFALTSAFDPSDTALQALNKASNAQSQLAVKFTFKTGATMLFYGYVSFPFVPAGQAQGLVESPLSFSVRAAPTVYAA